MPNEKLNPIHYLPINEQKEYLLYLITELREDLNFLELMIKELEFKQKIEKK